MPETDRQDIHSDGSVELQQRWQPGGAQGNSDQVFVDGDQYLFAIRLATDHWEYHIVIANCDSESRLYWETPAGDAWGAFDWTDVEWFVSCNDFDLPFIP